MTRLCPVLAVLLCLSPLCAQDVVIYGSTPGGIACAVRAAREGATVLMVTHAQHVGGLMSSGLSTMDALYAGKRAPIYEELRAMIHAHYRRNYGKDSPQHRASLPGNAKAKYEARVVEHIFEVMLKRESRITVKRGWYPVSVEKEGAMMRAVTFRQMDGTVTFIASGKAFVDCSYEGDLAAVAKVPYRVGRESREEYGEEHAGKIFLRSVKWPPAQVDPSYLAEYRRLNLIHYDRWFEIVRPQSSGEASPTVQGYNMRTVLTYDPENRIPIVKPANYDRDAIKRRLDKEVKWASSSGKRTKLPNQKTYWNVPELIGVQTAYVEGDWADRRRVTQEHIDFTLALLYFVQNDESIPEADRKDWQRWGLPKDEFPDNGNVPYEIYMRETRRITGRAVFTEHDARTAPHLKRAPVHRDSIGITDWFLDSHPCTAEKVPGSMWEGEFLLNNITVPGQVPWRCLLPPEFDNLIVPVCLSASHVGWGAIRLEPAWISYGEAAAHAISMALRAGTAPAKIETDALIRRLAEREIMLTFFNDVEKHTKAPWYAAVQYLGTQGFFGSYDAKPLEPLTDKVLGAWLAALQRRMEPNNLSATADARMIWTAEHAAGKSITGKELAERLTSAGCVVGDLLETLGIAPGAPVTRGDACRVIFIVLARCG